MSEQFSLKSSAIDSFNQCDEALSLLAKGGNVQAMEILVNRYRDFVKACSRSYFLMGADREDVIQEGMIGLYKAILGFDAEKNASFKTFARLCIKRQVVSAVKMSSRQKHMPLNTYVSLNKSDSGTDFFDNLGYVSKNNSSDPEAIVIERENVQDAHDRIDKALSEFEAKVLMYHLNGVPYGKIAVYLGKDPKSVDNALQRIKRKTEKFLLKKKFCN